MTNFDFKKVESYMRLTNWTWAMGDEQRVPTLEEIKTCAYDLLNSLEDYESYASTGGFTASSHCWDKGTIILTFDIEEYEASNYDC